MSEVSREPEREAGRERGRDEDQGGRRGEDPEILQRDEAAQRARARTREVVRENRSALAEYLNSFSCALAAAARTLREEGRAESSAQADRFAHELGRASEKVRGDSLGDLAREAETRARAHPTLTFGGAALLGFALSRALKSADGFERAGAGASAERDVAHRGDGAGEAAEGRGPARGDGDHESEAD